MSDNTVLCGHFTAPKCRPHERYPELVEERETKLITFLRNPAQLALSRFFYSRSLGHCDDANFREMIFEMVGIYRHVFSIDEYGGNIEAALKLYSFVGITEELQTSLRCLFDDLGIATRQSIPHINRMPRHQYPDGWQQIIEEFNDASAVDYAVYQCARQRLHINPEGA